MCMCIAKSFNVFYKYLLYPLYLKLTFRSTIIGLFTSVYFMIQSFNIL